MNILDLLSHAFFFTGFFTKSASYPRPLPIELERKYLELAKNGDLYAREKLINHNLRLVAHIAKKYKGSAEFDDLISVGSIGLIKGIASYKLGHGTALATYLARCIENEILMMLRSNKRYSNTVYLQDQIGVDNEGNSYTLMDVLSEGEDNVFHQVELSILSKKLNDCLTTCLTQREQEIVTKRYGLDGLAPLTQLETAKQLGISRSYISRIETKALQKLKAKLNNEVALTN
ncbi:MAG: RNA polymerase sporulation sigma factor SigK [Clostridia bacterium]